MPKVTLVMEYAEITFDLAQPDVQPTPGVSLELPLEGYTLHTQVKEVTITFPTPRIVLTSAPFAGKTFYDIAADLAQTDYASNVTARDTDDEDDD